jgi:uncharacterized membrane protein YoaK (UPF0700 family)
MLVWGRAGRPSSIEGERFVMKHYAIIIGAFVGGAIGATIGESLHRPAMWLPLGIGIGLAIGIEIRDRKKRNLDLSS